MFSTSSTKDFDLYLKSLVVNGNMSFKDTLLLMFPLVAQLEAEFFYGCAFLECQLVARLHQSFTCTHQVDITFYQVFFCIKDR